MTVRPLIIVAWVLATGTVLAGACWYAVGRWHPSRADFPFQGIDVRAASGAVDWHEVKAAGADFAYAVATEGSEVRDASFARHWPDIAEAGLRRGAIHRFSLCRLARDQASNFVRTVARDPDALPAAVELEPEPGCATPERAVMLQELATLIAAIETHTGKPALLKVSPEFEAAHDVTAAIGRPVWSLRTAFPPSYAARPWRMWQANPMRRIKGVDGAVGWNVVAP